MAPRAKSDLAGFQAKEARTSSLRSDDRFVIDNVLTSGVSIENGFIDGMSLSLWADLPGRFPWLLRFVRNVIPSYRFGLGTAFIDRCLVKLLIRLRRVSLSAVVPGQPVFPSTPIRPRPPRIGSEHPSYFEGGPSLAHMSRMTIQGRNVPSPHIECAELATDLAKPTMQDADASHFPPYDNSRVHLCAAHSGAYSRLRGDIK